MKISNSYTTLNISFSGPPQMSRPFLILFSYPYVNVCTFITFINVGTLFLVGFASPFVKFLIFLYLVSLIFKWDHDFSLVTSMTGESEIQAIWICTNCISFPAQLFTFPFLTSFKWWRLSADNNMSDTRKN